MRCSNFATVTADRQAGLERSARVFGLDKAAQRCLALLLDRTLTGALPLRLGDLVRELGDPAAVLAMFEPMAPLVRWRLVKLGDGTWLERPIVLHESFWPRLVGHWPRELPRALRAPATSVNDLVLSDELRGEVARVVEWTRGRSAWPTVWISGARGSGRRAVAFAMAAALELPALVIPGAAVARIGADIIMREAIWQQAAVVVDRGEDVDAASLAALAQLPAPLLVTTVESVGLDIGIERPSRRVSVPLLATASRLELWKRSLARAAVEPDPAEVERVASRYRFGPEQIDEAVQFATNGERRVEAGALLEACRAIPRIEVGGLARRIDTVCSWDDLVVPPRIRSELELLVTYGRHGQSLHERAGARADVRLGRGMACLFWGAPGTGKTMASQIVARALDRELYRVDLAQVVDKYLGETEKRLDRLFREAEAADAVLLFDEADTLFTHRTEVRDARDRYANLETGFMLQRLEEHRGVCILASNARSRLDSAFQRRLLFVVEFPVPQASERRRIWQRLLPSASVSDAEIAFLADRFPLAGGDIRNAVTTALLLAERDEVHVSMREAVVAGWREMTKAGRMIDRRELEPWGYAITEFLSEAS